MTGIDIGLSLDLGRGALAQFNLLTDPTMVAIHEPDSGLVDLADVGQWGALISIGTSVPIGGSFDGKPAYQITAKTGTSGYLRSTLAPATAGRQMQPVTLFVVGRWGAAATINTPMAGGGGGGNLLFWSATQIGLNGGSSVLTSPTPNNFHVYEVIFQAGWTYVSVDGAAYTKTQSGPGGSMNGLYLGALSAGGNPTDCDVLGVYVVEGQPSDRVRAAIYARIKARYPTTVTLPTSITAAAAAVASLTPSPLWDPTAPWDIVVNPFSQSNFMNAATDNATSAGAAGTFELGADYVWRAFGDPAVAFNWLNSANQVDTVNTTPFSGRGNLAGRLLNDLHTASGRPTVIIPMAQSASAIVPGVATNIELDWNRDKPRGNNLRDSLYWSSVYRAKEGLRWGGTIRRIVCYQGNTEALFGTLAQRNAWPAQMHALIRQWCADVGIPNPYDNAGDATCKTVIVQLEPSGAPTANFIDFRTNIQPTIQTNANQVFLLNPSAGPYEADNAHLRSAPLEILGASIAAA